MLAGVDEVQSHVETRSGEQESGDELARCGGIDLDATPADAPVAADRERKSPCALVVDVDPEVAQRADEAAHRPMEGGLVRGEMHVVLREPCQWSDEAHDGAGLSAVDRGAAVEPRRGDDEIGPELMSGIHFLDAHPEGAQRVDHARGVVRVQRSDQAAGTVGDRGDDQLAVRQGLRTGDRELGVHGHVGRGRGVGALHAGGGIPVGAHRFSP